MTVKIRVAGLFDAPELARVSRAVFDTIDGGIYAPAAVSAWRSMPEDGLVALIRAGRYRVADACGVLAGGAGWDLDADGASATIRLVFVHPAVHGTGVGAALLRSIERELGASGVAQVFVPAALNAVGFYEQLGYRRLDRREVVVGATTLPYRRMFKDAA